MAASILTLNGVVLDPNTVWQEKFISQKVVQSVKETLGGGIHIYALPRGPGKKVTLVEGWAQWPDVELLMEIAAEPGGVYELDHNGDVTSVIFRHEEEPAFEAAPLISRLAPDGEDWFVLTIRLMTV